MRVIRGSILSVAVEIRNVLRRGKARCIRGTAVMGAPGFLHGFARLKMGSTAWQSESGIRTCAIPG
jgi:hypothetical protein